MPWLLTAAVGVAMHLERPPAEPDFGTLLVTVRPHDLVAQRVIEAVGSLEHLPASRRRAFQYTSHFSPIPLPGPSDWLSLHPERGQGVEDYLASHPNRPESPHDHIYIQPLSELSAERGPTVGELAEYARRFFGRDVTVLPIVPFESLDVPTRMRDGHRQYHAGKVLDRLREELPHDTYCLIAVTLEDLYPRDEHDYVFGLARLHQRVGVFSFARYHPEFFGRDQPVDRRVLVRRGLKVMSHEIGHMFGLEHCIHLHCNMNGANHLAELDRTPMHLCPVCHRKLDLALGIEPERRYADLAAYYRTLGFDVEADWAAQREAFLREFEAG